MVNRVGRVLAVGLMITATAVPLLSVTAPAQAASSACDTIAAGRIHALASRPAYQQGLLINYNMNPVRQGYGSAIFFHVSTGGTTAGCISTDYNTLVTTIRATRPGDVIVEGVSSAMIAAPGLPNLANGSFVRAVENGRVYRMVGRAPLWLSTCVDGCVGLAHTAQSVIDQLPKVPAKGAFLRAAETGRVYRVAGGAPLWLSTCVDGCAGRVNVNQWTVNTLDHLRAYPADGTLLLAVETGRVYQVTGGSPTWLAQCPAQGCVAMVKVNQWTVDTRDHLRP